jgi:hypothetical protein
MPHRRLVVDISRAEFDARALGFSLEQMQDSLHARFDDGRWVTGLDATLWSWRAARAGQVGRAIGLATDQAVVHLGYRLFCRLRPHLGWLPHPDGSRLVATSAVRYRTPRKPSRRLPGADIFRAGSGAPMAVRVMLGRCNRDHPTDRRCSMTPTLPPLS